jgi:hypothetical protein
VQHVHAQHLALDWQQRGGQRSAEVAVKAQPYVRAAAL